MQLVYLLSTNGAANIIAASKWCDQRICSFVFSPMQVSQKLVKLFAMNSPFAWATTEIFGMTNGFGRFLLHFRYPTDATLAPLSNFRYSRSPTANGCTIQINIILLLYYVKLQFLSLGMIMLY